MASSKNRTVREQTPAEELANAITHGVGLALAVAGLVVGAVRAASRRNPWTITSVSTTAPRYACPTSPPRFTIEPVPEGGGACRYWHRVGLGHEEVGAFF